MSSNRGEDLLVTFDADDGIESIGGSIGGELAASRAQLRGRIREGVLYVEAKLRVYEFSGRIVETRSY